MAHTKRRGTVLLVDDSPGVIDVLGGAFEEAGYEVVSASDGEEVFRKLSASDPDALLLDVYMPRLNSADLCRLVKAHPHWKRMYLVLTSPRLTDEEIQMYRRLGADEILKKPLDPERVVALVEKARAQSVP